MDLWNAYVNSNPRDTSYPPEYLPMVNAAYAPMNAANVTDDDSGHSSAGEEEEEEEEEGAGLRFEPSQQT